MSAGKPVIAAAAGGPLELIEHGVSGCLFPPRDAGALAGVIKLLLRDRTLATSLADAAKQQVTQTFSADRMSAQMSELYRNVLSLS
jgi:glycosyltransferase involved in cell wall biosynthesis